MTLGERIYTLRTQKNLSQGDLAEALDVSRQSISKWETNGSIPELDKLIKLSEIFSVSLDELILNKQTGAKAAESASNIVYVERQTPGTGRKTAAVILFCFAALVWLTCAFAGGALEGLVLAAPFVGCGFICLYVRKYAGLWCGWLIYLLIEIYLRLATGVSWQFVFTPHIYTGGWTIHLIVSWCMLAAWAALTAVTTLLSGKIAPGCVRGDLIGTVTGWAVYIITWFVFALPAYEAQAAVSYSRFYRYASAAAGWARGMVLAVTLIFTVRLIRSLLKKRKMK